MIKNIAHNKQFPFCDETQFDVISLAEVRLIVKHSGALFIGQHIA